MPDERTHECSGRPNTLNFIRYSPAEYEWLFCTGANEESVIYHCPYCGEELEEV